MFSFKALDIPIEHNLADFSIYLWQQGIPHRIHEQSGRQVLWVSQEQHIVPVQQAYQQLACGAMQLRKVPVADRLKTPGGITSMALFSVLRTAPWTLLMILLSLLGAGLPYVDHSGEWLSLLSFQAFDVRAGQPVFHPAPESFAAGQYWRLLTPIFLHFGLMHILFNSLWLWELGRRIELQQGALRFLALIVLVGIGSNMIQYLVMPNTLFGGMSGVIYGLLGYCWFWDKFQSQRAFALPPGIIGFMLVWLMIGYSGFFEMFGLHIANAAHLSGLIIGVIMGGGAGLFAGRPK